MYHTSILVSDTVYDTRMERSEMPSLTFGEWLTDQLQAARLSRPKFANRIGYSQAAVQKWVRGERIPEERACILMAELFGVDPDEVLERVGRAPLGQPIQPTDTQVLTDPHSSGHDDFRQDVANLLKAHGVEIGGTAWMRVIGRVPADTLRWAEWENEDRTVPISADWLGSRPASEFFVLEVSGDCLVPRKIHDGMLVLCRRLNGERPKNDRVVVVRIRDEYTLKVWREDGNHVWLEDGHGQIVARLDTAEDVAVIAVVTANWFHHED